MKTRGNLPELLMVGGSVGVTPRWCAPKYDGSVRTQRNTAARSLAWVYHCDFGFWCPLGVFVCVSMCRFRLFDDWLKQIGEF